MTQATTGTYPPAGSSVTRQQLDALLSTLATWINDRGDRLVQLDERAGLHGSAQHAADVDIAFILWQAIGERRQELADVALPDNGATSPLAAELTWRALTDRSGTVLAANLPEAVALVDELTARAARAFDGAETETVERVRRRREVEEHLMVAERLANSLGDQVRAAAQLRERLVALSATGTDVDADLSATDWSALVSNAARLRSDLETTDRERTTMLARLAEAHDELDRLRQLETDAHAAATACADLFVDPPRLAIPSVDAVVVPPADVGDRPWTQARPTVQAFVELVDRLDRALTIAVDRFSAPKRERDDLRGLLQAYRDKADSLGQAERDDIDAAYRAARAMLWNAPCDLAAATTLTADYQRLVNSLTTGPSDAQEQL